MYVNAALLSVIILVLFGVGGLLLFNILVLYVITIHFLLVSLSLKLLLLLLSGRHLFGGRDAFGLVRDQGAAGRGAAPLGTPHNRWDDSVWGGEAKEQGGSPLQEGGHC